MSEISSLGLAVRLFIECGRHIRSWTTRFFAANGALLAALAALIAWGDPADDDVRLFDAILVAICLLGAFCSVMLGSAIVVQQRWRKHFVDRIRILQDQQNPLLPSANKLPEGALAPVLTLTMTLLISIAWIALLVLVTHLGAIVETTVRT